MNRTDSQNSEHRKQIVQLLRRHGISPTVQRIKIASTMLAQPQHLSADQVLKLTNQTGRPVSKATVYNSLGLFARKGLIRELFVDQERAFYDSSTHPHHHYYDRDTQEIRDIDEGAIKLELGTPPPDGCEISGVEVVIHIRRTSAS
ncbi:Fur family transcriptional regulator [Sedimenticola sp.]|uniref:Fur family transcriptional regulator n=1 Tax=Sedimenticola sp. TaxID=1940285 RepID=UPI003D102D66